MWKHILLSFIFWWIVGLSLSLGYCEQCCYEPSYANIQVSAFHSFGSSDSSVLNFLLKALLTALLALLLGEDNILQDLTIPNPPCLFFTPATEIGAHWFGFASGSGAAVSSHVCNQQLPENALLMVYGQPTRPSWSIQTHWNTSIISGFISLGKVTWPSWILMERDVTTHLRSHVAKGAEILF